MVTETFLNSCFSLVFSKDRKVGKDCYRDILEIISFCLQNNKVEIPIIIQNKLQCLESVCKLKLEDRQQDNIVDSIFVSEKYKLLQDFIESRIHLPFNEEMVDDTIKQIRMRKQHCEMFPHYGSLLTHLETIKNGAFDTLDDIIEKSEGMIKETYSTMMKSNRIKSMENASALDLVNDDFNSVVDLIKEKYDRKNTVSSGIPIFDDHVFNGGFAKGRLYIFGGGSGSGKSTLMLNSLLSQVTGYNIDDTPITKIIEGDGPKVFPYITLENLVDESLLRSYQCLYNKIEIAALREMTNPNQVKEAVIKRLRPGHIPIISYYPKYSIGVLDIANILDDTIDKYGKGAVKCLFIDYLDLLKSDIKNELHRLELGYITSALKDLAIEYNIPIITATQLNRSVYGTEDARAFNLSLMSESMKKVDHADFVAMMLKDRTEDLVHMRVGKNRSGLSEVSLDFKVDFKIFKFLNGYKVQQEVKDEKDEKEKKKPSNMFSAVGVNEI